MTLDNELPFLETYPGLIILPKEGPRLLASFGNLHKKGLEDYDTDPAPAAPIKVPAGTSALPNPGKASATAPLLA